MDGKGCRESKECRRAEADEVALSALCTGLVHFKANIELQEADWGDHGHDYSKGTHPHPVIK